MSLAGQLRGCGDCVGNVNISRHAGVHLTISHADVVELVDTHALGACASRREGSSPFIRTKDIIFRYTCYRVGFGIEG